MKAIGIDACKYGWVCASLQAEVVRIFTSLEAVLEYYSEDIHVFIDMPIGLPDAVVERNCEAKARQLLAPKRKSSLFNVPCREAVYAGSFSEANRLNKQVLNKGLSIQSWNIAPKIKELDQFLRQHSALKFKWKEAHPELAFHVLNQDRSMLYNKKTPEGIEERLLVLEKYNTTSRKMYKNSLAEYKRKDLAADDILDALALATLSEQKNFSELKEEEYTLDAEGLPMQIHY